LAAAEEALQLFQETYGLLVPEDQASALVKTVAQVEAERLTALIQLNALSSQVGADHPDVQRTKALLVSIESVKAELEGRGPDRVGTVEAGATEIGGDRSGAEPEGASIIIDLARLPGLSLDYLRLYREVQIRTALFELLTELLEQYRIQEVRNLPTIQVLDHPLEPTEKARPFRGIICTVTTLLGFLVSLMIAIFLEWLVVLSEHNPHRYSQVTTLLRGLGLGFMIQRR